MVRPGALPCGSKARPICSIPAWGLPIPGPDGLQKGESGELDIVPATLDQLLADESLLARMNADAEHPYRVAPADLKNVVALVEASPTALSRRMKAIESHLQGKQKMVLTASAAEQAERWKSTPGVAGARLWQLPYETIRRRSELKPLQIVQRLLSFLPFYAMPVGALAWRRDRAKSGRNAQDLRDIYKGTSADDADKTPPNPTDSMQDTESQKLRRQLAALSQFSTHVHRAALQRPRPATQRTDQRRDRRDAAIIKCRGPPKRNCEHCGKNSSPKS